MRWLGLVLLVNDLVPTVAFMVFYQRYQPGPRGWRGSEFGRQMMTLAGVLAGLLVLSIATELTPPRGWPWILLVVLAVAGHLSLSAALWWRGSSCCSPRNARNQQQGGLRRMAYGDRHPATLGLLRFFEYEHLPTRLQAVSLPCAELASAMAEVLPDGPELTTGLRKLLEAKDCFVRAALDIRTTSDSRTDTDAQVSGHSFRA